MQALRYIIATVLVLSLSLGTLVLFPQKSEAAFSAVTARGSAVRVTGSNTSIAVSPTANITVGKIAFMAVVTDNESTSDGCNGTLHTLTGTAGNTWSKVSDGSTTLECTETDGSADDGVTISLFWARVTTQISTTDSVTVSFNTARSDIIGMLFEVTVGAGNTIQIQQVGTGPASDSASVASLPGSTEYLLVGLRGGEGEDAAKTPTSGYSEIFDLISGDNGQPHTNVESHVQTRIATVTSDTVTTADASGLTRYSSLTAIKEIAGPTAPTVTTGFTGNVGATSANLFGAIVNTGGENATARGFATSTSPTLSSDVSTTTQSGSFGTGQFSRTALFASADTTYYYRAYATNSGGTGYGSIRSFVTGNTTVTRKMRLFSGFTVKLLNGQVILHQR